MDKEFRKDYCNNCGNYGHVYKNCRHPILSYGILLYNSDSKIVMIERKDSLSYIEFMRGKYSSIYDIEYIKLLFSRFSNDELEKIKKYDFDSLWSKLWIHTETINQRIKKEYKKSKSNFLKLKEGYILDGAMVNINILIDGVDKTYPMNEWEIPKGRRRIYENNRECAIREFREETNITNSKYSLYDNTIPLTEEYTGINGVRYKHVYYIGYVDKDIELYIDKKNKDQYTEIKDIKWFTKEECLNNIRNYDNNKKKIINLFFNFLDTHKNYINFE
jgi:8-oxo-dGTP pyrophosphatase MutT (NUDIX family)